ncbi:hypothetical protein [Streptomyces viridochromogenes]|nr:hypothetical protein [Streptomyces viridochromogenes]
MIDDIDRARAAATAHLAFYGSIPSHRRIPACRAHTAPSTWH